MDNDAWTFHLIDQLLLQGVSRFCIAPGSRSTPLALAAARHPKAQITVHPDERGLGFFALGCAMGTGAPAAVIATSGTAVGNLLPSVMEAHHSSIPLILLTADRPPELRDCSANQTTDQVKIFQNFLGWQTDLPCSGEALGEAFVRSQAAYAVSQAMRSGPVQINCQFREPLFQPPRVFTEGRPQPYFLPSYAPDKAQLSFAMETIARAKRGLILIGRLPTGSDPQPILHLAASLGWPVFADLLSQARSTPTPEQIQQFDYAIRSKCAPIPDCVLHFGGRFLCKFLPDWIHQSKASVLHIDTSGNRVDSAHTRPARIIADPALFCRALHGEVRNNSLWLDEWQEIDRKLLQSIENSLSEPHPFVEADLMHKLSETLPVGNSLFLANSMPIRDAEHFCTSSCRFFANRGLSGIDGQIATAAGIAFATKAPMTAVIGDQSCLHDLNSIMLLRNIKTPFLLIISNNFGGGIFSHMPVSKEVEHFETLFAASHDFKFDSIAKMFGIPYCSASQADQLQDLFPTSGARIIEIFTSRKENACFQKNILEKCCLALSERGQRVWQNSK